MVVAMSAWPSTLWTSRRSPPVSLSNHEALVERRCLKVRRGTAAALHASVATSFVRSLEKYSPWLFRKIASVESSLRPRASIASTRRTATSSLIGTYRSCPLLG